jgi:hypothetical protein
MREASYDANLNILCDAELKIRLKSVARVKGLSGFSPLVRSILTNAVPSIIEQMTDAEKEAYARVLKIENEKYTRLQGDLSYVGESGT